MKVITNICDACGAEYRPYKALCDIDDEITVDFNAMTVVKILRDGQMHGKGKIELCPNCKDKVTNFVFNELVTSSSPFIMRQKDFTRKMRENSIESN